MPVLTRMQTESDSLFPLIVTLKLEAQAQQYFDALREKYFPPDRNFLKAHLTLFHQLPPQEPMIETTLRELTQRPSLKLGVREVKMIGRGVAFVIESEPLKALHRQLQNEWAQWLIPQDQQRLWPHITVQNKVSPAEAKALQQELQQQFEPFEIQATGLVLWEYHQGPWQWVQEFLFEHPS